MLVSRVGDGGVETCLPVRVILDGAHIAIGLHERILSPDSITVSLLLLVLVVAGMGIVHSVLEGVLRMCVLRMRKTISLSVPHSLICNNQFIAYEIFRVLLTDSLQNLGGGRFDQCRDGSSGSVSGRHSAGVTDAVSIVSGSGKVSVVSDLSSCCVLSVARAGVSSMRETTG